VERKLELHALTGFTGTRQMARSPTRDDRRHEPRFDERVVPAAQVEIPSHHSSPHVPPGAATPPNIGLPQGSRQETTDSSYSSTILRASSAVTERIAVIPPPNAPGTNNEAQEVAFPHQESYTYIRR
jgi:hypothetical protein